MQLATLAYTALHIYYGYWAYGYEFAFWQQIDKRNWYLNLERAHRAGMIGAALGPVGYLVSRTMLLKCKREIRSMRDAHPQWHAIDWYHEPTDEELAKLKVEGW